MNFSEELSKLMEVTDELQSASLELGKMRERQRIVNELGEMELPDGVWSLIIPALYPKE